MQASHQLGEMMKAPIESKPEPGLWVEGVATPEVGINDVLTRVRKIGDLRHRPAHVRLRRASQRTVRCRW